MYDNYEGGDSYDGGDGSYDGGDGSYDGYDGYDGGLDDLYGPAADCEYFISISNIFFLPSFQRVVW